MNEFPLTQEQFAAWLAERADTEIVGQAANTIACPLVCASQNKIAVSQLTWREIGSDLETPLPAWAINFVHRIDAERVCGDLVTAAVARAALNEEEARNG